MEAARSVPARRVLFTALPLLSHFLAQVPLARAVAGAGHEVRFAVSSGMAATARRAGFGVEVVPMRPGEATGQQLALPAPEGRPQFGYLPHAARVAPALLESFTRWCPDVVVRDPLELGSCLAAEAAGIPHAVGREGPFWPVEQRRTVLSGLDHLRTQLGLAPDPEVEAPYRYLAFAFAPPELLGPDTFVPPVLHFVQPAPADSGAGLPADDWRPPAEGRSLVYATLGTVSNRDTRTLQALAYALAGQPYEALLTVGPDQDLRHFAWAEEVPNLQVRRYVPQTLVLPRSALMVAHGGFGTVVGALVHGVPLVLLPIGGDQHRNARWCAAAGAAVVIDDDSRGPLPIQQAVAGVLSDPSYRAGALRLQRAITALPEMGAAVALVERLAAERNPLPRTR